jgi:hypothetical protein
MRSPKSTTSKKTSLLVLAFSLALIPLSSGCLGMVARAGIASRPTYAEIEKTWEPLSGDKGRIVLYCVNAGFGTHLANSAAYGVGITDSAFEIDGRRGYVIDGTFLYFDCTPKKLAITEFRRKDRMPAVEVPVIPGQVTYVQLAHYQTPKVTRIEDAKAVLERSHHAFSDAQSWDSHKKENIITLKSWGSRPYAGSAAQ